MTHQAIRDLSSNEISQVSGGFVATGFFPVLREALEAVTGAIPPQPIKRAAEAAIKVVKK